MRELQRVFDYGDHPVRTVVLNGEVWFIAKDVCEVLEINNSRQAITRLDEDEKAIVTINDGSQNRHVSAVNESGLYELIFTSRKKEAKQFKRWVTHDVLPSIRNTGSYDVAKPSYTIEDPIKRAEKWIEEQKEKLMLEQRVAEYEPKVTYYDKILQSKGLVTVSQIAKDYGLSPQKLNKLLHEEGVQYKVSGQWLLYAKHADRGYTKSQSYVDSTDTTRMNTKWTQKGRLFIHQILTQLGYDPDDQVA